MVLLFDKILVYKILILHNVTLLIGRTMAGEIFLFIRTFISSLKMSSVIFQYHCVRLGDFISKILKSHPPLNHVMIPSTR